ncbi:MAG: hypothetical protein HY593_01995 [Candidatus Omnitrophica bacterium]|nr:hypothetical protein [Candidatus Omnitrophota bacterium]
MTSALTAIQRLGRNVFTTREAANCRRASVSGTAQALRGLAEKGILLKVTKGVWCLQAGGAGISAYRLIPFLLSGRAYVSFISALHLHGMIEQIPQEITLASTGHTKTIRTPFGTFRIHQLAPSFFKGFDWYKGSGSFLIAEPEKAFVDCLYLSVRKKKQFGHFPELRFPKSFRFSKVKAWAMGIADPKARSAVLKKLEDYRGHL